MRRVKNYEAEYSRFDSPVVTYRDRTGIHKVEIETGHLYNADIEIFREKGITYVLSWNPRFPYVGIEKFMGHDAKGKLFIHKKEAIEEILGEKGLDLTPMAMAKRLAKHLKVSQEKAGRGGDEIS